MILRQNQIRLTNLSSSNADNLIRENGVGAVVKERQSARVRSAVSLSAQSYCEKRKLLLRREEKAHFEAHFFALDVIVCVIAGENAHKIHFLREIKIDRRDIA